MGPLSGKVVAKMQLRSAPLKVSIRKLGVLWVEFGMACKGRDAELLLGNNERLGRQFYEQ